MESSKSNTLFPFKSREDIIWASGLFEGEGWISIQEKTPAIGIQMSDKETLERFASAVGGGNIYYRKPRIYSYEHINTRKEQWAWRVSGFQKVQAIIVYLWPWLSSRRRARAKQVLLIARTGQLKPGQSIGKRRKDVPHGTVRKYWRGCKCQECKTANKIYCQELKLRWKESLAQQFI